MKRLAIIIPAYKENFLFETLQSLANQTNKDFNVYVGDDCSPYDLQSIVSRFEDRLDIHYVRFSENLGRTFSRTLEQVYQTIERRGLFLLLFR